MKEILTPATHINGWLPAVYMSGMSQNLFVSRIEFIRSKLSNFSAHVSGVIVVTVTITRSGESAFTGRIPVSEAATEAGIEAHSSELRHPLHSSSARAARSAGRLGGGGGCSVTRSTARLPERPVQRVGWEGEGGAPSPAPQLVCPSGPFSGSAGRGRGVLRHPLHSSSARAARSAGRLGGGLDGGRSAG